MDTNPNPVSATAALPHSPSPRPRAAPSYFHILAKPTGAICNLDCKYCFFLSKELLYPDLERVQLFLLNIRRTHQALSHL